MARDVRITSTLRDMTESEQALGDWTGDATHWTVTLRYRGRQMTTPYYMGSAYTGEPVTEGVLDCLLSDSSGYDSARDFADWCADYGYDTDSRKAERTYQQIARQRDALRRLLAADYDAFQQAER